MTPSPGPSGPQHLIPVSTAIAAGVAPHLAMRDILDVAFRQGRLILGGLALLTILAGVYIIASPSVFRSEMRYLVVNGRSRNAVSSDLAASSAVAHDLTEADVATEIALLHSRDLTLETMRQAGMLSGNSQETLDDALLGVEKRLRIAPVPKTRLVQVRYSDADPEKVERFLRALAATYMERHLTVHRASDTSPFFNQRTAAVQDQLRTARAQLALLEQEKRVTTPDIQKEYTLRKLIDLGASLNEADSARREVSERAGHYRRELAGLDPRIVTSERSLPNLQAVERLQSLATDLRIRHVELRNKLLPADRLVQQVEAQMSEAEQSLANMKQIRSTEQATDVNPVRQKIHSELLDAEALSNSLAAKTVVQKRQMAEYEKELARIEMAATGHSELKTKVLLLEEALAGLSRKRDQAVLAAALDAENIPNIKLVDPPYRPAKPEPKAGNAVIAGYLLSCLALTGGILMAGAGRRSVYTPWELEILTGAPVLGTVAMFRIQPTGISHTSLPYPIEEVKR